MPQAQQEALVGRAEALADELREEEVAGMLRCVVEEEVGAVRTGERGAGRELEQLVPQPSAQLDDDRRASQAAACYEKRSGAPVRARSSAGGRPTAPRRCRRRKARVNALTLSKPTRSRRRGRSAARARRAAPSPGAAGSASRYSAPGHARRRREPPPQGALGDADRAGRRAAALTSARCASVCAMTAATSGVGAGGQARAAARARASRA